MGRLPRYPIFVPSKGRVDAALTATFLDGDGVPFKLVVEPQEYDAYAARWGEGRVLTLPFSNTGNVVAARNWIKDYATGSGAKRHWQIDDNISGVWRWYRGVRLYCNSGPAFAACEDFADRYENVALAGLNYVMFAVKATKPFDLNAHVYSCSLILNAIPNRFRPPANEDVDMCLQVLADGWCTVLFHAFLVQKIRTMIMKGGNTAAIYSTRDARLKITRELERRWPGVVTTARRFGRPHHVVKFAWQRFDTPLKLREGIDLSAFDPVDEYGLALVAKGPVRSERLRALLEENRADAGEAEDHASEAR